MPRVKPKDWVPVGVPSLEPSALASIRTPVSCCVVASPGAGKTEFLAQKATYLLQTGICTDPKQILAVSFKREAAFTLMERVAVRCNPEMATRFTSQTFDGFSKGLVDRFLSVIPAHWRPSRDYEIVEPKWRDYQQSLVSSRQASRVWAPGVAALSERQFESHLLGQVRLPADIRDASTPLEFAVFRWIAENLRGGTGSSLTFAMINRLAELLLRANPQILSGLRMTYPFVFLDEFQDVTYGQYDLLATAFHGSGATLTAVGDNKQRIMSWAGARPDAFNRFVADYAAEERSLGFNYRSSPALVEFQHIVARALDPTYVQTNSAVPSTIDGHAVAFWAMERQASEAPYLAKWIKADCKKSKLAPRDYALIVRQKVDDEEKRLAPAFAREGIRLRNEARRIKAFALQDLLAEHLVRVVLAVFRLASQERAPGEWALARDSLFALRQVNPSRVGASKTEAELEKIIGRLRSGLVKLKPTPENSVKLLDFALEQLNFKAFAWAYPAYAVGDQLDLARESLYEFMRECAQGAPTWTECLDRFEGIDSVPLLTIHRSKGLQYHTTVILGLDDKQWWAFSLEPEDAMSAFFVALSRAKQRIILTYASENGNELLTTVYELLERANLDAIEIDA